MKNLKDRLSNIKSDKPSGWKEKAEYRAKNKKWLSYSGNIARRISAIMGEKKDLTQTKLAEQLNVKPQYISKILKGHENLTLETIAKLSDALNIELISFPNYKYSLAIPTYFEGISKPIRNVSDPIKYSSASTAALVSENKKTDPVSVLEVPYISKKGVAAA